MPQRSPGVRRRGRPRLVDGPAVTEAAIIATALRSVQANGPAGLALRDVARRLGVSLPTVQRHFATKDQLWRACVDAAVEAVEPELGATEAAAAAGSSTPREALARHLRSQVERATRFPGLTAAMSNVTGPQEDEGLAYLVRRSRPVIDRSAALLRKAAARGTMRPVDVAAFLALVGLGLSSVASSRQGLRMLFDIDLDDPDAARGYVDALSDILLYGLLPRDDVPRGALR